VPRNEPPKETAIGGPDTAFRTTVWSDILAAGDPAHPRSRDLMALLLRTYWKPAYMYVRTMWKANVEDAKDLTQAFFARLLEKDFCARLRPERGSFRGYLKRALKNFLLNARRHDAARAPARPSRLRHRRSPRLLPPSCTRSGRDGTLRPSFAAPSGDRRSTAMR